MADEALVCLRQRGLRRPGDHQCSFVLTVAQSSKYVCKPANDRSLVYTSEPHGCQAQTLKTRKRAYCREANNEA